MKVILQADVKGQGKNGQLVDVSDGYARNYLLPRKLAIEATTDAINAIKLHDAAMRKREELEKIKAQQLAEQLKEYAIKVYSRAGAGGKLFGSVTAGEISDALKQQHQVDIDRRKILLEEPIKQFGTYEIKAKLGHEVTATLYVVVAEQDGKSGK